MKENDLITNLTHLMRIHGNLTVSELARLTQIPQPTIHHILAGSTKKPRKKALLAIANYFSVTQEELLGFTPMTIKISEELKSDLKIQTVPIIDWELLKSWPSCFSDEDETLWINQHVSQGSFALIMNNSSMEPLFPLNSFLIFDVAKIPKDRDFVIVYRKGSDQILFNRLFIEQQNNFIKMQETSENMSLVKLDNKDDKIIGILIEVRIQY
ncbi:transcriptional regulator [Legionella quinlivanii]|uniref:Transcriptional regulator n=1 Tax=Legionella quinlivanii TaxID=45073 RepID=A0A364LFX9_9GAMM|nr:helix-turn-helix domain-containing protein [Legionella quinlivanii]RAP35028.1 transcriptional regulator [Legionella quinlivanii]